MSELNMREEFEKWFSNNGEHPKAVERNGDGYILMQADSSWLTWQAAWNRRAPEAGQDHCILGRECISKEEPCGAKCFLDHPATFKTQAQAEPIKIGQHWLEVAYERLQAGEPEWEVLLDYGYVSKNEADAGRS